MLDEEQYRKMDGETFVFVSSISEYRRKKLLVLSTRFREARLIV